MSMSENSKNARRLKHQAELGRLAGPLREAYDAIDELIKKKDKATVPLNYAIGVKVKAVKEDANYGDGGVKKLAKLLGIAPARLYECSRVAEAWPWPEFEKQMQRRDEVRGRPLSWTHWVMLAGYDDKQREARTDQALSEGWTIRELKDRIRGRRENDQESSETDGSAERIRRTRESAKDAMTELIGKLRSMRCAIDAASSGKEITPTTEDLDDWRLARRNMERLIEQLPEYVAMIDEIFEESPSREAA